MRNYLISTIFFVVAACASTAPFRISDEIREQVKMTEDYGILSADDINIYAWIGESGMGENHWMCYPVSALKLNCRNFGPDPFDKISYSELEFNIETPSVIHEVGARRAIEYSVCQRMIARWREMVKGESHFCVGGESWNSKTKNSKSGKKVLNSTFDKFRTKKGCDPYFRGYCDPEYWRKFGYPNQEHSLYEIK